jgi:hypothetical protein
MSMPRRWDIAFMESFAPDCDDCLNTASRKFVLKLHRVSRRLANPIILLQTSTTLNMNHSTFTTSTSQTAVQ